jgi:hypothetical protein
LERVIKIPAYLIALLSFVLAFGSELNADEREQQVVIVDSFIELRSGPGRGYPVFHIEEKGETIVLLKKKTQWFKVRTLKGKEGWVHEDTMARTLLTDGANFDSGNSDQEDFSNRAWETGVLAGDFGGATSLTLHGGWNFTNNLGAELSVTQALGNVADIRFANVSLLHQPFPEWRVSPYFKLGAGIIQTSPFTTLVQTPDRTDEIVNVGFGVKAYISRQFFIRAEYSSHTILTSRNDNDEVEEWKLGFSVFF